MQKRSPIQKYYLFKSFVIMFVIQAVIVLFTPMAVTAPIWYQILALNIAVSAVLGWYLYKQWYHIEFSYDDEGFSLRKGKSHKVERKWSEFSQVSLVKSEYGEFSVRLRAPDQQFELPASKLKLDPFEFRSLVTGFVENRKLSSS
jgi:hypothetical protein